MFAQLMAPVLGKTIRMSGCLHDRHLAGDVFMNIYKYSLPITNKTTMVMPYKAELGLL